jgi:hypothetical protein
MNFPSSKRHVAPSSLLQLKSRPAETQRRFKDVVDCCSIAAMKTTEASDSVGAVHSSSRRLGIIDTKDRRQNDKFKSEMK